MVGTGKGKEGKGEEFSKWILDAIVTTGFVCLINCALDFSPLLGFGK
jgi:hypothetical protein